MQIARGAEAVLEKTNGVVEKRRVEKSYRHSRIDTKLRKERTKQETRLLEKAGRIITVPEVEEIETFSFTMEYIDGKKLRDLPFDAGRYKNVGEVIGHVHERDIIHGDLTTSNILVKNDELVLIDFGLGFFSQRIEDRATDLHLLKQVLESTHPSVWKKAWKAVEKGYTETCGASEEVLKRLSDIEGRGRYKA